LEVENFRNEVLVSDRRKTSAGPLRLASTPANQHADGLKPKDHLGSFFSSRPPNGLYPFLCEPVALFESSALRLRVASRDTDLSGSVT
jgi:hypothetical protein